MKSALMPSTPKPASAAFLWIALFAALYAVVLIRTAWLCDDAYITFRVIDNFLHGYGLRYNVAERVQVYTHPLWLFLLMPAHFLAHEVFFSSIVVSILVSLSAVAILGFGVARSTLGALFGITVLTLSRAFVDYSTSGLENPLTHLLLALFALLYFREPPTERRLFWLGLVAALVVTNRMDALLLYLPALAFALWRVRTWKGVALVALGFAPFAAWELFSLLYYGFLFPNTAHAKLDTGIPALDLAAQGLRYYLDSIRSDPLTLCVCIAAITVPLVLSGGARAAGRRDGRTLAFAAGILLYLLYVLKIGGDFMSGRFFATPVFCAALILARMPGNANLPIGILGGYRWAPAFAVAILLSIPTMSSTIFSGREFSVNPLESGFVNGIQDNRRFHYAGTGLLRAWGPGVFVDHLAHRKPAPREIKMPMPIIAAGMEPYFAGPGVYYLDLPALADPLRARLPLINGAKWYPGHFFRIIPKGYLATLTTGKNKLDDVKLATFYEHLQLVTRGPLLNGTRLKTILSFTMGRYNDLLNYEAYRDPAPLGVTNDPKGRPLQEVPQLRRPSRQGPPPPE